MTPDLFWIPGPWPGKLAVVARPRGGEWLEDEARDWKAAGLNVIVSFLEDDEAADLDLGQERAAAESSGLRFIGFPIPDRGVPASNQETFGLLRDITTALEMGSSVALHCRQSVGRAGLIAAALLMASGVTSGAAIETVSTTRGCRVPETSVQRRWLEQLPSEQLALAVRPTPVP